MTIHIGVIGSRRVIGSRLVEVERGVIPLNCTISDIGNIEKVLKEKRPDVIINAESRDDIEWCEKPNNQNEVIRINSRGLWNLAVVAEELKIPVIALSTDYIFDGKHGPYKEDVKRTLPVNYYGLSKWAMEEGARAFNDVKVIRTSHLFWSKDPHIIKYLDEAYSQEKVKVPLWHRSFMHIDHFVNSLMVYIENYQRMPKILNISGSETVDLFTFVRTFADAVDFPFKYKLLRRYFDDRKVVKHPKRAGLDVGLSAKLGLPQYSYLDGLELLK